MSSPASLPRSMGMVGTPELKSEELELKSVEAVSGAAGDAGDSAAWSPEDSGEELGACSSGLTGGGPGSEKLRGSTAGSRRRSMYVRQASAVVWNLMPVAASW
mmetsp:Transcript_113318/g.351869  ORF Transcript_113318/g.351869 Transcript_113318/m.351869 type:complete len:103 (-) Transcript_113318:781-1089(-)